MKSVFIVTTLFTWILLPRVIVAEEAITPTTGNFPSALADLRAQRERARFEGLTVQKAVEMNEAFFSRFNLDALSLDELASTIAVAPFNYGEKAKALALATADRMTPLVAKTDVEGALAAALRHQLSGPAGVQRNVRDAWASEYLKHPSLVQLIQGIHGDIALSAACTAVRAEAEKEQFIGLAGELDASRSVSAARAAVDYWNRIVRIVPPGERRQTLRVQLARYLQAVLALESQAKRPDIDRAALTQDLAVLEGAEARGEFLGRPAPEINFVWSSHEGWKRLSDIHSKSGKVLVLDFWATWCGPCVESFPHLRDLVAYYRDYDVEIVGVTSLQGTVVGLRGGVVSCQGDPEKEMRLMADYMREHEMTWPVAISREPVFNPEYGIKGIPTVTINAPDGTVRHSAPGFSPKEKRNRIDAILEEFHLRRPAPTP